MIAPAMIALIRDGQTTLYREPGGSALFHNNLIWGHRELQAWLDERTPVDDFDDKSASGVVVDFDARAVLWYNACAPREFPRTTQIIDTLIRTAWPEFEIIYADGMSDLRIAAGRSGTALGHDGTSLRLIDDDGLIDRCEALEDVAEDFVEFEPDDEDERYAWVTILGEDQTLHHRLIGEIPLDVIGNERAPIDRLMALPAYEVPAERNLLEAMLIDVPGRSVRVWGDRNIGAVACGMRPHWPDWTIDVIESDGYRQHCRFSGPAGEPLSEAEALGEVLPELLRGKQFDPAEVIGQMGQAAQGCLAKLLALVTAMVCFPFFVFAIVSGNWKSGAIAIGIIVLVVVLLFQWISHRIRRRFRDRLTDPWKAELATAPPQTYVGPTDPQHRRRRLDALLRTAGLPGIDECEQHLEGGMANFRTA